MSSTYQAADVTAALAFLNVQEGRGCGRCTWVCLNPHPGMYELQVVGHARRHAEIEAMSDDDLRHVYVMSEFVVSEFDNRIGSAELRRRGINPAQIERPRFQCWA